MGLLEACGPWQHLVSIRQRFESGLLQQDDEDENAELEPDNLEGKLAWRGGRGEGAHVADDGMDLDAPGSKVGHLSHMFHFLQIWAVKPNPSCHGLQTMACQPEQLHSTSC